MTLDTDLATQIAEARKMAHRAVTEGVNLKYVELMRQTIYELSDRVEAELARLREAESQARYYREKYEERAEELQMKLARLQEGLRNIRDQTILPPYSRDTLDRELNRVQELARALLADTAKDGQ